VRRQGLVVAAVLLAVLVALVAFPLRWWLFPVPHLEAAAGPPPFEQLRPTWAQDGTVHYGSRSFETGVGVIAGLDVSPYGMFLQTTPVRSAAAEVHTDFSDGRTTQRVPGTPSSVHVSVDGRYAAWIDTDGPRRFFGRIAQVVVLDLRTGRTVFHDSRGNGDVFERNPSDRYEETPPLVLGFDDAHVYWSDAEDRTYRWNLTGGSRERVRRTDVHLADPVLGTQVTLRHGRVSDGGGGHLAVLAPDGRSAVEQVSSRLRLTDVRTGRRVPLRGLDRHTLLGAWLADSSFYALTDAVDPGAPDRVARRAPGRIVRCRTADGVCTTVARVTGARFVVLPTVTAY